MSEFTIISIVFYALLSIIVIARLLSNRRSPKLGFRFERKTKNISWIKVLKIYAIIQVISILCSINNKSMTIYSTIGIPIMIMSFIFTFGIFSIDDDIKPLTKEEREGFADYEKRFARDNKIKKILK